MCNYLLVANSFLRLTTTMINIMETAHKGTKEPGGTVFAIIPILTVFIWTDHILLMLTESTGLTLEATTIH